VRDAELVDAAFLTTLTEQRHAGVYTCGTASLLKEITEIERDNE
jgi:hypothetical protein